MKAVLAVICACVVVLGAPVFGQDKDAVDTKRAEKAKQVAKAWFESLVRGETAVTTSLSAVPFALDRVKVIESIKELDALYESIVAKKGKREIKVTAVKVAADEKKADGAKPTDRIIVHVMIGDEAIVVCVRPGDAYKVVGFSD
jgi:nucleotide-binding universal stress UspA family protein